MQRPFTCEIPYTERPPSPGAPLPENPLSVDVLCIRWVKPESNGNGTWIQFTRGHHDAEDGGNLSGTFWTPVSPETLANLYRLADEHTQRTIIKHGVLRPLDG